MLEIIHVFRDGSHDPTKKSVPANIVAQVHMIRLKAEEAARQRAAQSVPNARGERV